MCTLHWQMELLAPMSYSIFNTKWSTILGARKVQLYRNSVYYSCTLRAPKMILQLEHNAENGAPLSFSIFTTKWSTIIGASKMLLYMNSVYYTCTLQAPKMIQQLERNAQNGIRCKWGQPIYLFGCLFWMLPPPFQLYAAIGTLNQACIYRQPSLHQAYASPSISMYI